MTRVTWHLRQGTSTACGIKDPRKTALALTDDILRVDCRRCLKVAPDDR